MITTKVYYWSYGDTEWWLVSKFFADSGYTVPYLFLTALRIVNGVIYNAKGAWSSVKVGDPVLIPILS